MRESTPAILVVFKVLTVAMFTVFGILLAPLLGYLLGVGCGRAVLAENQVGYAFLAVAAATVVGGFLVGLHVASSPKRQ